MDVAVPGGIALLLDAIKSITMGTERQCMTAVCLREGEFAYHACAIQQALMQHARHAIKRAPTSVHLKMGGLSKMSRLMTSSSGVALIRSVTMSVQCPKICSRRSFCVPGSSLPPAASLWKAYLQCASSHAGGVSMYSSSCPSTYE